MNLLSIFAVKCSKLFTQVFVNTFSVPPVNIVKVSTSQTFQYINQGSKYAILYKSVFSTSHVNTSPVPEVAILNYYLPLHLHVCDVLAPANLCHVCKVSPLILFYANFTITCTCHAVIKKGLHLHQQLMISPRESAFCNNNYECKVVSLQELR